MTDLRTGSLSVFPVRYPDYALAGGLGAMTTRGELRSSPGGFDSREISFGSYSFGHRRPGTGGGHRAIDIYGGFGCPVSATCSGVVPTTWTVYRPHAVRLPGVGFMPASGRDIRSGNYIVIVDDDGLHHLYGHMLHPARVRGRSVDVAVGDRITVGTEFGALGATGLPPRRPQHLHYQVTRRAGRIEYINPYAELRRLAEAHGATANRGGHVTLPLLSAPAPSPTRGHTSPPRRPH